MKRVATSGYFLITMSAFGFSFKGILAKLAYSYGVDTMTLMLMRMSIALKGTSPIRLITCCIVFFVFFTYGVKKIGVGKYAC